MRSSLKERKTAVVMAVLCMFVVELANAEESSILDSATVASPYMILDTTGTATVTSDDLQGVNADFFSTINFKSDTYVDTYAASWDGSDPND